MSREQAKAAQYIQQLDQARCNGNWGAVPELVRKIRKHAPERSCLALTAESEHAVLQASTGGPSPAMTRNSSELGRLLIPLSDAIEKEHTYVEDEFQAQICLGWIFWIIGESEEAASHLPKDIEQEFAQLDGTSKESAAWTRICAVKASYIKAEALSKLGSSTEALETLEAAIPIVTSVTKSEAGPELLSWIEHLLTLLCIISGRAIQSHPTATIEAGALSGFRAWTSFWERQSSGLVGGRTAHSEFTRLQVWKEYYATLSTILQRDLPYPITSIASTYANTTIRIQQRAELQQVEQKYERLLLNEIRFPRAEQSSEEVEEWVDLVVSNWKVLCGNSWQESELGQGGREAVSRGVLEILYRAATKTFHSTPVLRHLFTVHLAVAEFDLAFKAFDTYLGIVKKGKARVEKTGEEEIGLDDDEEVLKTASECIRALCRYGSREAAEKAKDLALYFEDWLKTHYPEDSSETINGNGSGGNQNGSRAPAPIDIPPRVFALAWRSFGISHAQWARLTFDAESRAEYQLQAVSSLRKALSPQFESSDDVETLFALAMVLAERRELNAAIEVVKTALLPPGHASPSNTDVHQGKFARERSLIPLWHLLALLLSARQEFTTAARSCEGAFEQFKDPKNLFGESQLNGAYRSEHLNRLELQSVSEKPTQRYRGLVDEMDDLERETVLEVKITQLVLLEVLEGPDVAVNASDELLSLYSRLFDELPKPAPATATQSEKPSQMNPPPSSAGTLRSIKGSIFGRSRRSLRKSTSVRGREVSEGEKSIISVRPPTSQTVVSTLTRAPTIHVTNENGSSTQEPHHHEKLQKRTGSLTRKKSHGSVRNRSTSTGRQRTTSRTADKHITDTHLNTGRSSEIGLSISPDNSSLIESSARALSALNHNTAPKDEDLTPKQPASPDTATHTKVLPQVSSRSVLSNPVTRFPKLQERRRRAGLLIRVWLLIAGFYRRAEMYEDAKGAIDEAYKLVDRLELNVAKDASGSVSLADGGWGAGKSVEELWADVIAERGYLEIAQASPYAALSEFELALTHFADHPMATVGLSNILLDIYSEVLRPPPSMPIITTPETTSTSTPSQSSLNIPLRPAANPIPGLSLTSSSLAAPKLYPLGLSMTTTSMNSPPISFPSGTQTETSSLEAPHRATSTAVLDRLAARDRAYGLLSALTKLGSAWTCSEAWYALARAYEEGGQVDKAREVLWWCVELEEGKGVRDWSVVSVGGYVL